MNSKDKLYCGMEMDYKIPVILALLTLLILTLFTGRKHGYTVDANASFQVTKEILQTGNPFPNTAVKQGYIYSVVYIPFYILAQPMQVIFPDLELEFSQRKMLCLMNTVFTAATASVLCLLICAMGYSARSQIMIPLIYAFSTLAFSYARYDYNKCFAAFLLVCSFYFLIRFMQTQTTRNAMCCGLFLGLLICLRLEMGIVLPVYLYAVWMSSKPSFSWKPSAGILLPAVFGGAFVLFYNFMYWQGSTAGGYEGSFTTNPFPALYGILFSPGKSLFVFNPVLLLLPLTLRFFYHSQRPVFHVWLGTVGLLFLVYCFWGNWWGGWGYGARHFVPLLPLLMIPLAECIEQKSQSFFIVFLLLAAVGLFVQVVGASVAFTDVIHNLMNSGITEEQLLWIPLLNPVYQHCLFMTYIPFSNWDIALIPFVQNYPLPVVIPVLGGTVLLSVFLLLEMKKSIKDTNDSLE